MGFQSDINSALGSAARIKIAPTMAKTLQNLADPKTPDIPNALPDKPRPDKPRPKPKARPKTKAPIDRQDSYSSGETLDVDQVEAQNDLYTYSHAMNARQRAFDSLNDALAEHGYTQQTLKANFGDSMQGYEKVLGPRNQALYEYKKALGVDPKDYSFSPNDLELTHKVNDAFDMLMADVAEDTLKKGDSHGK